MSKIETLTAGTVTLVNPGLATDTALTSALALVRQLQATEAGQDFESAVEIQAAIRHLERAAAIWFNENAALIAA